jgi:hypothetical protein
MDSVRGNPWHLLHSKSMINLREVRREECRAHQGLLQRSLLERGARRHFCKRTQ